MKKRTILFLILTLVWMCIVFAFSAETADVSKQTSMNLLNHLTDFFDVNITNREVVEGLLRSFAHFTLFLFGGMFSYALFLMVLPKHKCLCTFVFGIGYALLDEIHQIFVPGRAFEVKDIAVDFCGFFIGMCIVVFINKLWKMIKNVQNA